MQEIDKTKIVSFMEKRMEALRYRIEKDFVGNLAGYNEAFREVKYWKEAIERGVFDVNTAEKTVAEYDNNLAKILSGELIKPEGGEQIGERIEKR